MFMDTKSDKFYLLPKIHKKLSNVPGRPVISNCGYYTENIASVLDFHLQPIPKNVKNTNDFLKKLYSLTNLSNNILLFIINVISLYPNILYEEGLSALRKGLDKKDEKEVSTDTLVEW